jgi:hypothetical protein
MRACARSFYSLLRTGGCGRTRPSGTAGLPLARFRFRNYSELLVLFRCLVIRHDFDQIGFSSSFPKGKGLLSGCPA